MVAIAALIIALSAIYLPVWLSLYRRRAASDPLLRRLAGSEVRSFADRFAGSLPLLHTGPQLDPEVEERVGNLVNVRQLQRKIVVIAGSGSVGSWTAHFLAANFVSNFFLIDLDRVEPGNLGGRTVYQHWQIGLMKVDALTEHLRDINPHVSVHSFAGSADVLLSREMAGVVERADLLINVFDGMETLLRVADRFYGRVPQVFAGFHRHGETGHVIFTRPGITPCFRCSMGITDGERPRRLDAARALPSDIQRVAFMAARVALALLALDQRGSAAARWLSRARSNFLLVDNRSPAGFEWLDTQSVSGCPICGGIVN